MSTPSTKVVSADAKTILLIEDDEAHALLIRRAFESHPEDYVIDVVRTLREARDALGHRIPALVIADYRLPDGEGVELLQAQSNIAPVYPVVIMTGHGDEHLAVESMRAGALDYIVKSDASMGGMPRTADRVLREWHHIEQRRKAEQALALSEERYALAAEATNDGLWDWNLETNTVYYSPRLKAMLGFAEGDLDDTLDAAFGLVHKGDVGLLRAAIDRHLSGSTPHLECECRMLNNNDGDFRWMMMRGLAVRYSDGIPYRMAGSLTDIHERKRAEQQLQHDALHDALTGLPNRALFMDRLSRCLERARRCENYLFAVLFLDLDRFKVVNDSLGHMVGDELLKTVADRLLDSLRDGDTVCRFGGDEFGLVLDGIDREEEAMQIAKRIALSIEKTYRLSDDEVFTTASIGIALGSKEADSAESLIHNADTAMFRAKAHGRGYVELFKGTMHMDALQQLHLENDLRRALAREELTVFYQPIVSLESGRIEGFEALVRWQHPEKGLVLPCEFIPLAEETGLINAMGRYVLKHACAQLREWQHRLLLPDLTISVNISARQCVESDLADQIKKMLHECALKPSCLKLEITENLIMENTEDTSRFVEALYEHGIGLAMDDFGTGYSSLSYLHSIPVDTLKIDRSFVSQMDADSNGFEIVRTIITLARTLKINVTAEGVENINQLQLLRALQCPMAQGFYFSKPLDVASAEALLNSRPSW